MHEQSKKDTRAARVLWSELHSIGYALNKIDNPNSVVSDIDKEKLLSYVELLGSNPQTITLATTYKVSSELNIYSAMIEEDLNVLQCLREIKPDTPSEPLIASSQKALKDWIEKGVKIPDNLLLLMKELSGEMLQKSELALYN
jgi:hypothetical protein